MSHTHHIGDSAESVNRSLSITPRHPLLVGATLKRADVRDVLDNCVNTLVMLADLLGDADQTRFPTLDTAAARRGMFRQLHGVANTLEAIEKVLGIEAERACEAREAEQQARRAEDDRIAVDPGVLEKRAILAGAFFDVFDKVLSDAKTAEGATA